MKEEQVVFADSENDDLLPGLTTCWTLQIAEDEDADVVVYADQPGYPPIKDGLKILKDADKIVFHNALGYDFFAINKLYPGTLTLDQMIDTLVMSRHHNSTARRHSLGDLGEALGFKKLDFHDFSKFSEKMVTYGIRDVQILQKMWKGDRKRGVPSFKKMWERDRDALTREFKTQYIISKQIQHGFRFDKEAAEKLEMEFRQEMMNIERKLQKVFPPIVWKRYSEKTGKRLKDGYKEFNIGSRDQIGERLIEKYGWKPKKKTNTGKPKIDEEILADLPYPEAKDISRYLDCSKKLGQVAEGKNAWLKAAEEKPCGNFYIHGYVNTLGTRTTRMSHSKPNVAQADSDPRMRACFLADPDWDLVGTDAEGLELRMLSHYLYPYDDGVYANTVHSGDKSKGTDIHTMNQKAANLYLRPSAKTMIYAHNYGCGDAKLGIVVKNDAREAGQPIPTGSDSAIGKKLRADIEVGIIGLGELIKKCKKMHMKRERLPGIDGRWIRSASAHSALNTLLQGNGSIVMKEAVNQFEDEMVRLQLLDQYHYCANVHDEFQVTSHPDISKKVAEVGCWSIKRAGEVLGIRCPLVGAAEIGKTWADTH